MNAKSSTFAHRTALEICPCTSDPNQTVLDALPAPAASGSARALTQTVPQEYVHRAATSEVLLTGWRRAGDGFLVTAQWPRAHQVFTPLAGQWLDPLLIAESIRQAGLLLAHTELDVPLDRHFALHSLQFQADPEKLRTRPRPANLVMRVTCPEIRRRGEHVSFIEYHFDLILDGESLGQGRITVTILPPAVYRRMRDGRTDPAAIAALVPPEPEAPLLLGRELAREVAVGMQVDGSRQLRVDREHPVYFDHQVDHVPGMLLLEAARQAIAGSLFPAVVVPLGIETQFLKYVELDAPCLIRVDEIRTDGDQGLTAVVTGMQNQAEMFRCTITAALLQQ